MKDERGKKAEGERGGRRKIVPESCARRIALLLIGG